VPRVGDTKKSIFFGKVGGRSGGCECDKQNQNDDDRPVVMATRDGATLDGDACGE
jgi:hypothetical protein